MQNTIIVMIGKKGSGKSTLVREIVAERPRVIVIDSLAEYDRECGCTPFDEDECLDAFKRLTDPDAPQEFRYSMRRLGIDDNLDLMRLCYECPASLVVVEETSLYCSPINLPDELAQLIRYGRHREIDLVFVARRPSELHRDLTANADLMVTFRTQEPRDLIYLRNFYGDQALQLPTLPDYQVRVFGDLARAPGPILHRAAAQND